MEREIKFRIWNGREMEYNITVGKFGVFYVNPEKGDGLDPKDTASLTPNTTKYFDNTPVMQFTGLKDSENIEVYEGDIINNEVAKWEVIFNTGCFCAKMIGHEFNERDIHIALRAIKGYKVIGNVHQNPELIK